MPDRKLVIELDGGQHADQKTYNNHRTWTIEKDGFKIIRFWNNEVSGNLEGVLQTILNHPSPAACAATSRNRGEVNRNSGRVSVYEVKNNENHT